MNGAQFDVVAFLVALNDARKYSFASPLYVKWSVTGTFWVAVDDSTINGNAFAICRVDPDGTITALQSATVEVSA